MNILKSLTLSGVLANVHRNISFNVTADQLADQAAWAGLYVKFRFTYEEAIKDITNAIWDEWQDEYNHSTIKRKPCSSQARTSLQEISKRSVITVRTRSKVHITWSLCVPILEISRWRFVPGTRPLIKAQKTIYIFSV